MEGEISTIRRRKLGRGEKGKVKCYIGFCTPRRTEMEFKKNVSCPTDTVFLVKLLC